MNSTSRFIVLALLAPGVLCDAQAQNPAQNELSQIRQAIHEKKSNWIPGESWLTRLSFEERRKLCGGRLPEITPDRVRLLSLPNLVSPPPAFDWRDNNGNWMTRVKNQGWVTSSLTFTCGCCWGFAGVGAIEAWWKIHHAQPDSQIDLSEQFILSCGALDCWSGGSVDYVYDFAWKAGIPSERCLPYMADDRIPCDSACPNWQQEVVTIPGYGYITWDEAKVENIKSALMRRPVAAHFSVYQDFLYYKGGVYEHVWGDTLYGHWVVITGWNDDEQSWICKNSFGPSWGDSGYFRIKWGDCGIGTYCPYIWDDLTDGSAVATTPTRFDLALGAGDSLVKPLTVHNLGMKFLEYSILDMGPTGEPVDWLEITSACGVIAGGDSAVAQLRVDPKRLKPGQYQGMLIVFFNDTTIYAVTIPVELRVVVSVPLTDAPKPTAFSLSQNYPNPFNPMTKIQFTIVNPRLPYGAQHGGQGQLTIVKVFDLLGREVATLVNGVKEPGSHTVEFDGSHLSSGIYIYRMQAGDFVAAKKLLLLR